MKPLILENDWSVSLHGYGLWDGIYLRIDDCPICEQTLPKSKENDKDKSSVIVFEKVE